MSINLLDLSFNWGRTAANVIVEMARQSPGSHNLSQREISDMNIYSNPAHSCLQSKILLVLHSRGSTYQIVSLVSLIIHCRHEFMSSSLVQTASVGSIQSVDSKQNKHTSSSTTHLPKKHPKAFRPPNSRNSWRGRRYWGAKHRYTLWIMKDISRINNALDLLQSR